MGFEDNSFLEEAKKNLECCGSIPSCCLKESTILSDRIEALSYIPRGGICAEVGVAYGDFSRIILDKVAPKKFYAIDYFSQDDPYCNFWGMDLFRKDGMPHQIWYEHRFMQEIDNGVLETCQGFSWDVLKGFRDDYFDYIYLDAGHDFFSVSKDIEIISRKLKNGGFIQFNDYTIFSIWETAYYGIVPAVNSFLNNFSKSKVIALCMQQYGYYDLLVRFFK